MKELILQKAFVLFLKSGYNGTSMIQIQNEAGVSRGAIYHHFKSKEQIYIEVVNKYLISVMSIVKNIPSENKTTLYNTIILSIDYRKHVITEMRRTSTEPLNDFNYFKLIYDACDVFNDFAKRINLINEEEILEWKIVIEKAIMNNEIKKDIDVDFIANNFVLLPQGLGLKYSFKGSLDIDKLKSMYLKFYNLLKV